MTWEQKECSACGGNWFECQCSNMDAPYGSGVDEIDEIAAQVKALLESDARGVATRPYMVPMLHALLAQALGAKVDMPEPATEPEEPVHECAFCNESGVRRCLDCNEWICDCCSASHIELEWGTGEEYCGECGAEYEVIPEDEDW